MEREYDDKAGISVVEHLVIKDGSTGEILLDQRGNTVDKSILRSDKFKDFDEYDE